MWYFRRKKGVLNFFLSTQKIKKLYPLKKHAWTLFLSKARGKLFFLNMRRVVGGLKAPGSINANSLTDQYANNGKDNFLGALLWAPTHKTEMRFITFIKSYLMEFVAMTVFAFLLLFAVVSAVNNSADMALRSILVALVGSGSYYMITGWLRKPDEELPRHGGWTVTLSYALVLRFGIFHSLIYMVVHVLGALTASGLLSAFGVGASTPEVWVPQLVDTVARSWAAEIIGTTLIVFSLLYNHMAGVDQDNEGTHRRDGEVMASAMRLVATLIFFRLGHFTFEPALYLAGLFTTCWNGGCLSDTSAAHLSAGFFLGVPLIGVIIAVALYILGVVLSATYDQKKLQAKGATFKAVDRNIHAQYSKLAE
jgi:hypothetical protein